MKTIHFVIGAAIIFLVGYLVWVKVLPKLTRGYSQKIVN